MHQLQRVNGEARGFGALACALAFGGMDVFWVEGEKFSVDNTRSLRQVLEGHFSGSSGCLGDAHDGQQMERSW